MVIIFNNPALNDIFFLKFQNIVKWNEDIEIIGNTRTVNNDTENEIKSNAIEENSNEEDPSLHAESEESKLNSQTTPDIHHNSQSIILNTHNNKIHNIDNKHELCKCMFHLTQHLNDGDTNYDMKTEYRELEGRYTRQVVMLCLELLAAEYKKMAGKRVVEKKQRRKEVCTQTVETFGGDELLLQRIAVTVVTQVLVNAIARFQDDRISDTKQNVSGVSIFLVFMSFEF